MNEKREHQESSASLGENQIHGKKIQLANNIARKVPPPHTINTHHEAVIRAEVVLGDIGLRGHDGPLSMSKDGTTHQPHPQRDNERQTVAGQRFRVYVWNPTTYLLSVDFTTESCCSHSPPLQRIHEGAPAATHM